MVIKPFSLILTIALAIAVLLAPGNAVQAQVLPSGVPPTPSAQIQPGYVHCTAASPSVCYLVPTIVQCVAYTKIIGCTDVLPTLATCITSANTAGCTVVLPSPATCLAAPKTSGCMASQTNTINVQSAAAVSQGTLLLNGAKAIPTAPPTQAPIPGATHTNPPAAPPS